MSPEDRLKKKIFEFKNKFTIDYKCALASNLIPHITLSQFVLRESNEIELRNMLRLYASTIAALNVDLRGFGRFNKQTIFLKVCQQQEIIKIIVGLKSFINNDTYPSKFVPNFSSKPHVTIAKQMTERQFECAWKDFKSEFFFDGYYAKDMLLLRRNFDEERVRHEGSYKKVELFNFKIGPYYGRQTDLFDTLL
ncbi:2'-5' RNA ligase family protein [Mucilaginibacter sp. CSA2-8R]|uniref:2'-5' RNA ligase family protein n=1 Tax=Mucilaginibacter sp. CSA2-8R TaxID=3141542 RepID=UPI00315CDBC9